MTTTKFKSLHLKATGALHIHEEAVGALYKTLKLVVAGFGSGVGVKQIFLDLRKKVGGRGAASGSGRGSKNIEEHGQEARVMQKSINQIKHEQI